MTQDHGQMRWVADQSHTELAETMRRIVRALARADAEEEHKRQMAERDRGHDNSG
jgi:phage FluMu gp28-like protein